MTSPIVQINFAEEDQENDQRQFLCRSDGGFSDDDQSIEEKQNIDDDDHANENGGRNRMMTGRQQPAQAETNKAKYTSPQKKVTEACKTVYDELRKSLKRGKEDGTKKKHSFIRSLADMSGFLDEVNSHSETEQRGSSNSAAGVMLLGRKPQQQTKVPPVALKKPSSDTSDDDIPMARTTQERPSQFMNMPQNSTPRVVPPPAFPPSDEEDEPMYKQLKKPTVVALPVQKGIANRKPVPRAASFDRRGVAESDDGLEPIEKVGGGADDESILPPPSTSSQMGDGTFITAASSSMFTSNNQMIPEGESYEGEEDESYSTRQAGWLTSKLDDTLYGKIVATKWSCAQVSEFLEACGLGLYARTFAENGVDGSTLLELTHDQIRRGLNIHERLHLLSLELGVESLRQRKIKTVKEWDWSCPKVSEWLEAKGLGVLVGPFRLGAVHGGVLFSLTEDQFVSELGVGRDSVLILMSLLASIERARDVGPLKHGEEVPDWSPARVKTWLESLSLAHLVPVFKQFAVNGALLLHLDAQCMRQEMNVTEIQAIVLEKAIHKLRRQQEKHASLWMSAWKKVSNKLRRKRRNVSSANGGSVKAAKTTASSTPGSYTSLAATYSKYATHGQIPPQVPLAKETQRHRHHQKHRHNNDHRSQQKPATTMTPGKKMMVSQQPVSPAPSRPPRPSAAPDAKAKAVARQPSRTVKDPNNAEESTMSIL